MHHPLIVREINRRARLGKPVVAIYVLDGRERQGRIIRARRRHGILEVLCLGIHRWAIVKNDWAVWEVL